MLGTLDQTFANGILVDVLAAAVELFTIEYKMIRIPALPDGKLRREIELAGEAAFDALHGSGQVSGGDQKVNVVGHHDERVELVETLGAVVL